MSEHAIPVSWAEGALSDVSLVIQGQSPPGSSYNLQGNGLPFFQGKAEFGSVSPTAVKWCTEPSKIAEQGDVLVSVRAPVGPTNLADVRCCIGRGLAAIRPFDQIPNRFLLYYLRHSKSLLERQGTGTTFKAISGTQLRRHPVIVPPVPEQHRIVEAIESYFTRLDDAVATLERVQRNLKRYRASVLKAAVEGRLVPTEAELARAEDRDYEPASVLLERILAERRRRWEMAELAKMKAKGKTPRDDKWKAKYKEPIVPETGDLPELPEGWCWASVDQLASVGTGATPKRGDPRFWSDGDVPWVTSAVVNEPLVRAPSEYVTRVALAETNLSLYPSGTLLIAMYGEGKTRGRATVLAIESTTNQALAALELPGASQQVRGWLLRFFEHNYLELRRSASGGVQPNLNLSIVRSIVVPLPPLREQDRVVAEIDRSLSIAEATLDAATSSIVKSARVRQSILKWAFEGRLVDQDPTDEPASQLLERIHVERKSANGQPRRSPRRPRARSPKA